MSNRLFGFIDSFQVFRKWVEDVIYVKGFEGESVAWEPVLKMLIWVYGQDGMAFHTAKEIGAELGVSGDVVSAAYKVLDKQFGSAAAAPMSVSQPPLCWKATWACVSVTF